MINSKTTEYYHASYGSSLSSLSEYIANKTYQDKKLNYIIILFLLAVLIATCLLSRPIFAMTPNEPIKTVFVDNKIYLKKNFEENIKNKYNKSYVTFPTTGVAHIKQTRYINKKPIKINIVEINTNVNPNLKIKPQLASEKLNSKKTVRRIAQKQGATIAINGGYFKPQTGVPLGALMIDRKILTGPIYNRVGIAIFEDGENTTFKMDKIAFDIKAYTKNFTIKIDNVNQPRMLSTYTLLYTPEWGENSPVAPKDGLNVLIKGNKIEQISANPIAIGNNSYVISAPKSVINKIAKDKEIYVDIKLQESLQEARHIIGAGPYLVKDSKIFVDVEDERFQPITGRNPRSAIGFKADGTLIIVTIDGREKASVGMTLRELANLMLGVGCSYAMNFDGGSSSALYVDGKIANSAYNKEGVAVSNALLVNEIQNDIQISSL